jgi:ribosomal protein S18 acetylase RimI-like enzyme
MITAINRVRGLKEILAVLISFDEEFPRSISSRVGPLDGHARKLADDGLIYEATRDGVRAGFVAFYANDQVSGTAFLSHLAVKSGYRGAGVGLSLMRRCIDEARREGMKRIRLEVDSANDLAIQFYRSLGFAPDGPASTKSLFMMRDRL